MLAAREALANHLYALGLSWPETATASPWPGHLDLVVRGKTFAFISADEAELRISVKLPQSADFARALPFCKPTGYGLGKSGWVTATFKDSEKPPVQLLEQWIDESYRAQAPKKLLKELVTRRSR